MKDGASYKNLKKRLKVCMYLFNDYYGFIRIITIRKYMVSCRN